MASEVFFQKSLRNYKPIVKPIVRRSSVATSKDAENVDSIRFIDNKKDATCTSKITKIRKLSVAEDNSERSANLQKVENIRPRRPSSTTSYVKITSKPTAIPKPHKKPPPPLRQFGKSISVKNLLIDVPKINPEPLEKPVPSPIPLPSGVICIDSPDDCNLSLWPDFVAYLRSVESGWVFSAKAITGSKQDLDAKRSILMEWMLEVASHFRVCQETLYHTVAMIDSTLANYDVSSEQYQLVGVTAFLIAAKLEEYHPPTINDLLELTQNSYSRRDVVQMEIRLLSTLKGGHVHIADPTVFVNRFVRAADPHQSRGELNKKPFLHTVLLFLDHHVTKIAYSSHPASQNAAAAVYAARALWDCHLEASTSSTDKFDRWPPTLRHYTGYAEEAVAPLGLQMIGHVLAYLQAGSTGGIVRKFGSRSQHGRLIPRIINESVLTDFVAKWNSAVVATCTTSDTSLLKIKSINSNEL